MREIDRKCAEVFGWTNFERVKTGSNEIEIYGKNPSGQGPLIVPYYSISLPIAFSHLVKYLKNQKIDIMCAWYHDECEWQVSLFGIHGTVYNGKDENLATSIAIAFLSLHEGPKQC